MLFLNTFLSYLLVFIVFAAVAVVGFIVGKTLRQKKDAKDLGNTKNDVA